MITVHKGGALILFDTYVRWGHFFWLKFLNYIIFFLGGGGGSEILIFGGMKILWIFFGVTTKLD